MTRRDFLGSAMASVALARDNRPNVLFLSMDDMNDWVGWLGGYPGVQTPNIDKLAKRGVLFSDAHCAAPLCNPSRTALFTGLRPSTSGIYNNDQYWRPALPDVITLPAYFKQNGYHVAGAGKVLHHVAGCNPPDQRNSMV
jgi:arylsulfatase A-like enzyme